MHTYNNICAVVLAAGKGTRMKAKKINKVTYEVAGKPIILRILEKLNLAGIYNIVVVVGHAKNSVIKLLPNNIQIACQTKRLGTGHATKAALANIPNNVENILVLYGDDAFWYSPENFQELIKLHAASQADVTFCTTDVENPFGLGRILRGKNGGVIAIVEEKNASDEQKLIKEVNLGGFMFKKNFLRENISRLPKNELSGEYYITDMVDLAIKHNKNIQTLRLKNFTWRGINTPEELKTAEKLLT